ncbi:MAG TPA: hypothetical protein VF173_02835 [Thermoanaerobaculia bacterium]|nr:hypothetical protein [Thermoanaerobaculia bacterium]
MLEASLLSPTEWRILVAIHRRERPATVADVVSALPDLPPGALEALLVRLHRRGLLRHDQESLWGPLAPSFETLFQIQIEHFFDTYVLDDPIGLRLVQEALDSRLARTA